MDEPTRDPPFCCTAKQTEYLVDGVLYLAFHVTGHGWFPARPGSIDSINDDGTIVEATGKERRIHWRAGPEGS